VYSTELSYIPNQSAFQHPVFLPCKYKTQMIHLSLFFYKISLYQMPAWRQTGKTAKCQSLNGQSKFDKMPEH
jgi:hypothetical protein